MVLRRTGGVNPPGAVNPSACGDVAVLSAASMFGDGSTRVGGVSSIGAHTDETPERIFDREWAVVLLDHAITQLQAEMSRAGRDGHFAELKEFLTGEDPRAGYAAAATSLGMSEGAVRVAVHRLRRRLVRSFGVRSPRPYRRLKKSTTNCVTCGRPSAADPRSNRS